MLLKLLRKLFISQLLILLVFFLGSGCLKFNADDGGSSSAETATADESDEDGDAFSKIDQLEDGRYNLSFISKVVVDVSEYLEKHPDANSVTVKNGSESSIDLSYGGELETTYHVIDDGEGVTVIIGTSDGSSHEYTL